MAAVINTGETGCQIRKFMKLRGVSVREIKEYLSLGSVQSVYRWLSGKSLPTLDNLYALSELLRVPMDALIAGSRQEEGILLSGIFSQHLFWYYQKMEKYEAV